MGNNGLFMAYFVADMDEISNKLTLDLVKSDRRAGLAVIVFANVKKKFVKDEVFPLIPYWNYRSKDYVTFFFVGHVGDSTDSDYIPVTDPDSDFSEKAFVEAIEEFEAQTDWEYRGDTPIIICRAHLRYHKETKEPKAFLDLNSVIEFELERALRDKVIESIESLFEAIIKTAKDTPGEDVQWKLSDQLGARALCDALVDGICSKLPGAKRVYNAIRFFRLNQQT